MRGRGFLPRRAQPHHETTTTTTEFLLILGGRYDKQRRSRIATTTTSSTISNTPTTITTAATTTDSVSFMNHGGWSWSHPSKMNFQQVSLFGNNSEDAIILCQHLS